MPCADRWPHPSARAGLGMIAAVVVACLLALVLYPRQASAAGGSVQTDQFSSEILKREVSMQVYLPPGYHDEELRDGNRPNHPVLYLLHGAGGSASDWVLSGGVPVTMDGLIGRELLRGWIVVMPTVGPRTWWIDGNADAAESAFMQELVPYVDARYRTIPGREGRAIAGQSMGGYGALNIALSHPDRFCASALLSPAIYDPIPPTQSAARGSAQFRRDGSFDEQRWRALNWPQRLQTYSKQPQRVPFWIVSGDEDHLGIAPAAAALYWRMHGIQSRLVELRVVEGDHDWLLFRDELPEALRYIDGMCASGAGDHAGVQSISQRPGRVPPRSFRPIAPVRRAGGTVP